MQAASVSDGARRVLEVLRAIGDWATPAGMRPQRSGPSPRHLRAPDVDRHLAELVAAGLAERFPRRPRRARKVRRFWFRAVA